MRFPSIFAIVATVACSACVDAAPDIAPTDADVWDAGVPGDAATDAMSGDADDASTERDSGGQIDASGDAGTRWDGFRSTEQALRVGFDATQVGADLIVFDRSGATAPCPENAESFAVVGDTVSDVRVQGSAFTFDAQNPGRVILRFECQGLRAQVEVVVLPVPQSQTSKLAVWLRPDEGRVVSANTMLESLQNLATGQPATPDVGTDPPQILVGPPAALRFSGSAAMNLTEVVEIESGHLYLVYGPAARDRIPRSILGAGGAVSSNNWIRVPAATADVKLGTDAAGTFQTAEWNPMVRPAQPNVFGFSFTRDVDASFVDLSVNGRVETQQRLEAAQDGAGFPVHHIGSHSDATYADGLLYELLVLTEPLDTNGRDALETYLSDRYPE